MGTNCHHLQETVMKLIIDKFAIIHVKKKNKASLKENPNSSLIMSPVANKKR